MTLAPKPQLYSYNMQSTPLCQYHLVVEVINENYDF